MFAITVAILLGSVTFSIGKRMLQSASKCREVAAARTLINAYSAATAENDGVLMHAYDDTANGYVTPDGRRSVSSAAAHRYPFRLAPYFSYNVEGVILVNRNKAQIKGMESMPEDYGASLYPALGMNSWVGGKLENGERMDPEDTVWRMSQAEKASSMLVFASAGRGSEETKIDGYFELDPPNKRVNLWTGSGESESADLSPSRYGNVDFRHRGQAVCAFLDGSVRMVGPKELRDMRLWNRNAQVLNDPNYRLTTSNPGDGRGGGRR
jgi:prepilin-type processing-associated H-X9-DG protein